MSSIVVLDSETIDDNFDESSMRVSRLFEFGFFEIRKRLKIRSIKFIKANCMTCQRMGRQNLIQTQEGQTSNLVAHLKVNRDPYSMGTLIEMHS